MKINRKEIKKNSHSYLRKNFIMSIMVIFIFGIIMNNQYLYSSEKVSENKDIEELQIITYDEETNKIKINKVDKENRKETNEKFKGILQPIITRLGFSSSPLYNFSYSIKLFIYDHQLGLAIYSLIVALISFIIYVLFDLVLDVGKNRFYLESRIYHKTNPLRLLFPYKIKGTLKLSLILFIKRIYQALWSLTIIGGFIKMYEYRMIPYILAENPTIKRKEAFRLSKEMMKGYKWQAFKLDLSLFGWIILGMVTFGISNIIYFNAYKEYINAELYSVLREKTKKNLTDSKLLNDTSLFKKKEKDEVYPEKELKIPLKKIEINTDYNQNYSIRNYILLFFTAAFIGYSWEVFLHIVRDGHFVNRGTMFGPWLPIYGVGAVLILIVLKPFRKKTGLFIIASTILAGIVEYSTAWFLETFVHMKWWDYTGYFMNIQGRVCLEGLIVFALGGATITYFLAPLLNSLFNKIKAKTVIIICCILVSLFGIDVVYSISHPNTGEGITS